jgi:hypothetical protein
MTASIPGFDASQMSTWYVAIILPESENRRQGDRVEFVIFTVVGIALYFAADWALDRIEQARGARFENRSIIFFAIILVLALASFQIIGYLR